MRLPPAARYAAAGILFFIPAVWALMAAACLKWPGDWPQTCEPINYLFAPLVIAGAVWGFMGAAYAWRAKRRVFKGVWNRVNLGGWKVMEKAVRVAWGSEEDPPGLIAGEARFERRRWLIDAPNGQRVSVDRVRFWHWLMEVDRLQRGLGPGRSAISMRLWRGVKFEGEKLSEGEVLAYREILKRVGAVGYRTADARSMYYVPGQGAVWGRVEEFEKLVESEVY